MTKTHTSSQLRSRLILLLITAMFFASFGLAAWLRFHGWTPAQHKNYGALLQPPIDFGQSQFFRADGSPYQWAKEKHLWRIVVVPATDCTTHCEHMADVLHRLWLSEGRKSDRVDVLWFGTLPANAPVYRNFSQMRPEPRLVAALPEGASATSLPVYLIDPSGFLVMHYQAGFNPAKMKKDIDQLLK